ncbi:MAG TPA: hypothetical protein DCO89_01345 [Clostridiales bacterium]|nr:hypothetical protein [Clostridiales bacterium]
MWNEILNLAIKNGLWAVLFLGLFIFVIKDSNNREKKYQQTIRDLTSHLGIVKEIKEDVDEIKCIVFNTKKTDTKIKKSKKIATKVQKNNQIVESNSQNSQNN